MGITNSQYDAVMRVYEKRRNDNHHVEEERRRTAYEAIPELGSLDRAVASLSVQALKRSLSDSPGGGYGQPDLSHTAERGVTPPDSHTSARGVTPANLREHIELAAGGMDPEDKRRQLLRAHSFPEDYLDPVYTCRECRDTGWVGHRHCRCFDREVVSLFYTQSGLSDVLRRENFDTFDIDLYRSDLIDDSTKKSSREIMTAALNTCRRFADDFGSGTRMDNLLISGAAGLGKTFLTHCIAKELIDRGRSVIYYSAGELFDSLARYRFGKNDDDEETPFDDEYLTLSNLLIIDDLGTELTNSFVGSELFRILNTRISQRRGIVISTNLSPTEIGRIYSDRISSRIMESFTLIRAFGEDIRILKRLGRHRSRQD